MRKSCKQTCLACLILVCLLPNSLWGTIINVPADQPTVQDGINAAVAGDTVLLAPGTYAGSFVVDKALLLTSNYIFSGSILDIQATTLNGAAGQTVLNILPTSGNGGNVVGLQVINGAIGIESNADWTIQDNRILNNDVGILFADNVGGLCDNNLLRLNTVGVEVRTVNGLLIENNIFRDNDEGIQWVGNGQGEIANNSIRNNNDYGMRLSGIPSLDLHDNTFQNNGIDGILVQLSNVVQAGIPTITFSQNEFFTHGEDAIKIEDNSGVNPADLRLTISNNIIRDNGAAGVGCLTHGNQTENYEAADLDEEIFILNNTFVNNNYGVSGGDNSLLLNNIFSNQTTTALNLVDGNSLVAFSLMYNNGLDEIASNLDLKTTLTGQDPLLNAAYALNAGSPAIDVGQPVLVWNGETLIYQQFGDFVGEGPDLGALESNFIQSLTAPVPTLPANTATMVSLSPTLTWAGNLQDYEIEIFACPSGNAPPASLQLDQFELIDGPTNLVGVPDNLSGVSYNKETHTFFTVNNGDELIYEQDTTGALLRTITLTGFDDIEGIVHLGGNEYAITEEKRRIIAFIQIDAATTNINYGAANLVQLPQLATNNQGLEGVAYDPLRDVIYSIKEKGPLTLFQFDRPLNFNTIILPDYPFDLENAGLLDVSGLHHLALNQSAEALAVQDHLLVLSHESFSVSEMDPQGNVISTLSLLNGGANGTLTAQIGQAEGVCLDENGHLLVMSEPDEWYRFAHPNWTTFVGDRELVHQEVLINGTSITLGPNALSYSTQYCWRVRGRSIHEFSDWSPWFSFTTEDPSGPPEKPELISPANGAIDVPVSPTLIWKNTLNSATSFVAEVATDAGFTNVVGTYATALTNYIVPALAYETQYFWRIQGINAFGSSPYSDVWSFETEMEPDVIPPTQPINLLSPSQTATTVDLTWDAAADNIGVVGYYIYVDGVLYDSTTTNSGTAFGLAFNTFYDFQVAAYDAAGNISVLSPILNASTLPNLSPPVTLVLQIDQSSDDAEEDLGSNVVGVTSTDLELGADNGGIQMVGMRFRNANLPIGTVVINAYFQFTVDENGFQNTSVNIYGEDEGDPATYIENNGNITSRPQTSATVAWNNIANWNPVGASGVNQQSPNLNVVMQEVLNRPDWAPGQSLAFMIEGNGRRTAESYDGSIPDAPRLIIEYAEGTGPVLPGELLDFKVEAQDCNAAIRWELGSGNTTESIRIERAGDALHYQVLQDMDAQEGQTEFLLDQAPAKENYYRIGLVDPDGNVRYSEVQFLALDCATELDWRLFPNPTATDAVQIEIMEAEPLFYRIEVLDTKGQVVQEIQTETGTRKLEFSVKEMPQGTYFITIYDPYGNKSTKSLRRY